MSHKTNWMSMQGMSMGQSFESKLEEYTFAIPVKFREIEVPETLDERKSLLKSFNGEIVFILDKEEGMYLGRLNSEMDEVPKLYTLIGQDNVEAFTYENLEKFFLKEKCHYDYVD